MKEMLQNIARLSNAYGSNPDYVFLGGGNASVKTADSLYIKPSGVALATIKPEQFLQVDRQQLNKLFDTPLPDNSQIREAFAKAMLESAVRPLGAGRPSVETPLHNIIDYTYIVHLHPALVNGMTCAVKGPETARRLFPDALWIDYCDAGCKLAFVAKEALDKDTAQRGHQPQIIFLQNHGIFVGANTPEGIDEVYDRVFNTLRQEYEKADIPVEQPSLGCAETNDILDLAPVFRQLLADEEGNRPIVYSAGCTLPYAGPLTPDHIVYAKSFAYVGEADTKTLQGFKQAYGYLPKVIGVPGRALFTVGTTIKEAQNVAIAVANALQVQRLAEAFGGPKYMTPKEYQFIENWEVESYRRSVANAGKTPRRLDHKVAVITGAAQGLGRELAKELANNGAFVALADQDMELLQKAAEDICQTCGAGCAIPISVTITQEDSIANLMDEITRLCGGLDLLVANEQISKSGKLTDMTLQDWNQVTRANYDAFFLCAKHAARIMGRQKNAEQNIWSDIVQLNYSAMDRTLNLNGPAVGADAGALALTRYYARELAEDKIKVNAVCPAGLHEQGLEKKTAEACPDKRVMNGEGLPKDVAKAILYCVEQTYETGQILTVTGGRTLCS